MSEQSRLGRELYETGYVLKRIIDAGVQVFFYLEDREAVISDPVQKMMLSLAGFASEMERHQGRQRTYDAMQRKASRGHVAGGKVYGYRNVRAGDHVEREIVPEEAAMVRRIFEEITQGRGFARIAQGLNRDTIPSPRPGRGWAMTGVHAMVFRDLYRGRVVWGKTRWVDRGGTKVKQGRPESEWVVLEAPALRIVTEDLWQAAHARLDRTRQTYLRRAGGTLWGRPESGMEARHLLTGFLVCGECGSAMHAIKRTSTRGRPRIYFTCNGWRVNGTCTNAMSAHLADVDAVLVACLQRDVLVPDMLEAVAARAAELYASEPDAAEEHRQRLTSEAQRLQGELARFTEAIRLGGPLTSLVKALQTAEQQRADVLGQLEHLDGVMRAGTPWANDVRAEIRRRLADWSAMVGREPAEARQVLRKLIVGRLTMTPKVTPEGRWYEITGRASYGALLTGVVGLVPPEGNHGPWTVAVRCVARAAA